MARATKKENYAPRHPEKYSGRYPITLRSSWEVAFARFCDMNESVLEWASEPVAIPYFDPISVKQKVYIPDFAVRYIDSTGEQKSVLVEIKPSHEARGESARGAGDVAAVAKNTAKWESASWWCQRRGINFMVLTEGMLFGNTIELPTVGHVRRRKNARLLSAKRPKMAPRKRGAKRPKMART